ncbi:MAG: hypothetical protein ACFWT5_17935 [Pseudomonas helleri]|jgi:hypothetical protein|uniref:hypothetical protein n=1 Tax=Pseudomonas helleri TaxID=1608996 RepID=UPI001294FC13|nr:hypothetical protein [Pseudomonas helleri]MQT39006.1 hypothetical protein [Pseudomonas helleri]
MKYTKILLASLFLISAPQYVYADGGSGSNAAYTCRGSAACPSGQDGKVSFSMVMQAWDSHKCPAAQSSFAKNVTAGWANADLQYRLKKDYAWGTTTVSRSCVNTGPVYQSTQTEIKSIACEVGEIGSIQQKQTYEVWSDGTKINYSGWVNVSSTCKPIPTKTTETKDGVQEETCDSYFGVAQGTYSGTVYKHGTYITTYSATTKTTDTKFQFEITNVDSESCVAQITDVIQETNELACPSGQTGSIQRYRVKATNSQGLESFPYGEQWIVSNNNCASTQTDTQPIANAGADPDGLLSNISVTSSSLQNGEAFSNYLNSLSASNWATSERHKLIVNIDDLSSGKYSASKVGAVISKFQSVVGAGNSDIEIALPRTIDKYTGNGDITAKAVKDKTVMVKDVSFEGGDVILTYMQLGKKTIEKPQSKEIVINVIPKNLSLKGVFAN